MSGDWKANVIARLEASRAEQRKTTQGRWGQHRNPLQLSCSNVFLAMLDEAVVLLDTNRAAFVRRSASVVAASLLDQPVSTFLRETPFAYPRGQLGFMGGGRAPGYDTGEGIEAYCPHPGCDGAHLTD